MQSMQSIKNQRVISLYSINHSLILDALHALHGGRQGDQMSS
jgi:hypothetical protein